MGSGFGTKVKNEKKESGRRLGPKGTRGRGEALTTTEKGTESDFGADGKKDRGWGKLCKLKEKGVKNP